MDQQDLALLPKSLRQRALEMERRFAEMDKRTEEMMGDTACMSLPHPARIKAVALSHPDFMPISVVGLQHEDLLIKLMREGLCTRDMWQILDGSGSPQFFRFMSVNSATQKLDGGYNGGASGAIFHTMRYHLTGGTMFTIDDDLLEMLEHTDIDLDIPMSDVKLPFPTVYVELGRNRQGAAGQSKRTMHNDISGEHVLEGAYVSFTKRNEAAGGAHVLEVTMTGSPLGKRDLADDAVEWVSMDCGPERTIRQALHEAFHSGGMLFGAPGTTDFKVHLEPTEKLQELENRSALRLELVIKALLYIGMPDLRKQLHKDRTEADKAVARASSGAHKRKALRNAARTYDTVLILPPAAVAREPGEVPADGSRTMAAHWRRGHFRTQRYGAAYALRKTVWIQPVLVNADALPGVIETHRYVAKA